MSTYNYFPTGSEDNPVPEKLTVNPCPPLDSIFMALGPKDDDLSGGEERPVKFTIVDNNDDACKTALPLPQYGNGMQGGAVDISTAERTRIMALGPKDDDLSGGEERPVKFTVVDNNDDACKTALPLPQYGNGMQGGAVDISTAERTRIMAKAVATDMDLYRKRESERIHTEADRIRAKNRADVQSLRELKRTRVDIESQGDIRISVELFGGDKKTSAPFYVGRGLARYTCPGKKGEILAIPIRFPGGDSRMVYLDLKKLDERTTNRVFDQAGIRFGYSRRKESEIRGLFLDALVNRAPIIELPPYHGFWRYDGEWSYASNDDLTWQEVSDFV